MSVVGWRGRQTDNDVNLGRGDMLSLDRNVDEQPHGQMKRRKLQGEKKKKIDRNPIELPIKITGVQEPSLAPPLTLDIFGSGLWYQTDKS